MKRLKLSKSRTSGQIISENKKPKMKKSGIIVGVIIFIMVFSSVAIGFFNSGGQNTENKIDYNGFGLVGTEGGWVLNLNGINYGFEYKPSDVEGIGNSLNLNNEVFSDKIYVVFDPAEFKEDSVELLKLRQFLLSLGKNTNFGCIKEDGCGDIPVVSCDGIGSAVYLDLNENTQIYKQDNCIVLSSAPGDEFLVINRFMYGTLGVIND